MATNQVETKESNRLSTRQLLDKIPNYPCLYRHSVNGTYYGIKKVSGKRKEHSLGTSDRRIAEKYLKEWLGNLDKVDVEAEKTTLGQLIEKFKQGRAGLSESTQSTEEGIIAALKDSWKHGMDIRLSKIRPSMLDEWLADQEKRLKSSSYNRYTLFLKQLFEIAVADRMIPASPFEGVKRRWLRPEKPIRRIPTQEQFQAIVDNVRSQQFNAEADESANFIEFLGLAGLGQAEASSITWGDIDWENNRFSVRRKKTGKPFNVPIYPHLKPFLQRLYANFQTPPKGDVKLFKILDAKKALANACTRLGYHAFTQRNIRAVLIRRLWQSGVDVKLIAKWQGHSDGGKLILSTYTEVFSDNDADYIQAELAKVK